MQQKFEWLKSKNVRLKNVRLKMTGHLCVWVGSDRDDDSRALKSSREIA